MGTLQTNILVSLAGWLAWNVIMLSIHKDENEKSFNLKSYSRETWDNWLASLVFIPVLLYIGHAKLSIDIESGKMEWSDLYYVCSGFAVEAIKEAWKKWKKSKAN